MGTALHILNDNDLAGLLKSGNEAAFIEIYNRYWDKLFAVAYNRLRNEQEAEEAVQDIFVSIWQRRETLELQHSIATYLSVAVKYRVITRLAQMRKKQQTPLEYASEPGKETTAEWISEKELRTQLDQHVNALPEKCRIVFKLSREEGLTNVQIARQLDISEKTVEGHITKALHTLRSSLKISLPLLLLFLGK